MDPWTRNSNILYFCPTTIWTNYFFYCLLFNRFSRKNVYETAKNECGSFYVALKCIHRSGERYFDISEHLETNTYFRALDNHFGSGQGTTLGFCTLGHTYRSYQQARIFGVPINHKVKICQYFIFLVCSIIRYYMFVYVQSAIANAYMFIIRMKSSANMFQSGLKCDTLFSILFWNGTKMVVTRSKWGYRALQLLRSFL